MASASKTDIPEIASFMSEFWLLVKKYWIPENSDEYWEDFITESSTLGKKYSHDFCIKQILAFVEYLEGYQKEKGK